MASKDKMVGARTSNTNVRVCSRASKAIFTLTDSWNNFIDYHLISEISGQENIDIIYKET